MAEVVLGLVIVAVGLAFCFRGYVAMRVIIPVWGAFSGFMLGAGLVASLADEGFLASLMGWLVGFVVALAFAALAYLYYEVSVFIAMSAIGFALGTAAMVALGVRWSWLIVLVGLIVGVFLALVAILADLPMALLTVLTAMGGATVAILGVMLLVGLVSVGDLGSAATTATVDDDWWWYALYLVLVVAGISAQLSAAARLRGSLRASWTESGGRQIRTL
ncbi:MAG TPA: hypothetical protein VK891_08920 [Euzebyales bacterium]|nr:hypothetical protein [Euzebyales bacterium]